MCCCSFQSMCCPKSFLIRVKNMRSGSTSYPNFSFKRQKLNEKCVQDFDKFRDRNWAK